jgi:ATP sulfurylase
MTNSREDMYISGAIAAIKSSEAENYDAAEAQYTKYTDLDKWKKTIFEKIKNKAHKVVEKQEFLG